MKIELIKTEPFSDYAKLVHVFGAGSNSPTKFGIDGYQVDFTVKVGEKLFNICYQTAERYDNIMAYNGYEMGCYEDNGFISFCDDNEIEHDAFLDDLEKIAESYAKNALEILEEENEFCSDEECTWCDRL